MKSGVNSRSQSNRFDDDMAERLLGTFDESIK
jgi:hypothetical protein